VKTEVDWLPRTEAELRSSFWDQISSFPEGHKIKSCLQCGTCTGACPVAYAMDLTPRTIIGLFRAGRMEEVVRSQAIWLCASCYSCTVRCPMNIRVTDTMYAFKRVAMERELYPKRFAIPALSQTFINMVQKYGRNYELALAVRYYLRAKLSKVFAESGIGWALVRRGRLRLVPQRLKRVHEVRAIIERANQFGEA
jgi:quinone-modifying oxidoreductase subunit QmoC